MLKRLSFIIIIVSGMFLFLLGCTKDGQDTLAFIGDEKDMKTCYEIYPEEYFPTVIDNQLCEGRFPPDIVGEYEMNGSFVEGHYEYYDQTSHQYKPYPTGAYPALKSMYIIIEEQVNGMARIRFAFKRSNQSDYNDWYDTDAYIYGDVYSENSKDFLICFENIEGSGVCKYIRGNIIKGTIDESGILNIDTWSVIKDRDFTPPPVHGINDEGGYEHYHADFAARQNN